MLLQKLAGWLRRTSPMLCLALIAGVIVYAAPQAGGYHVIKRMPVGGEGGWDYMTVDPDTHRLYIARGSHFMVVDDTTGKVIGDIEIANSKNSHGLALALDLGKGFTSNGDANTVSVVDLKTLKATSVIDIPGKDPDSIRYDPATKRVFTFNGKSMDSTVIDATSGKVIGTRQAQRQAGRSRPRRKRKHVGQHRGQECPSRNLTRNPTRSRAHGRSRPAKGPPPWRMIAPPPNFRGLRQGDGRRECGQRQGGCFPADWRRSGWQRLRSGHGDGFRLLPRRLRFRHSPGFSRTSTHSSGISTRRSAPARWRWTPKRTASTRRPRTSNPRRRQRRTIRGRVLHRSQGRS